MANHKSAEKRARQSIKRTKRNNGIESSVKTAERNLVDALKAKSKDTETLLRAYMQRAMSAISKGVLKKETVSRKIGRLSARVSQATTK